MAAPNYTIRQGAPSEGAGILRVHRASILALGRNAYRRDQTESWAAGLLAEGYDDAMTEGGETFLLAEDAAGEIIAFCSYKAGEVPDWARGGVGRALLVRAEAAIAAAGHRRVTTTASLTGRPFYEAQGYAALRERAWTTRGGLKLGVFEMAKSLARWRRWASAGGQDRLAAEILRPSRAAASSPHDADREPS